MDGEMSGAEVQRVKPAAFCEAEGCPQWLTVAHICMDDTPHGFYIEVFQRDLGRPRRFRLVDHPILEGSLEFTTVSPVEAFVKLSIRKAGVDLLIRVETLAFDDRGYDRLEVPLSRHSFARSVFHIVFKPQEEVIHIRFAKLSDFKTLNIVLFNSFTPTTRQLSPPSQRIFYVSPSFSGSYTQSAEDSSKSSRLQFSLNSVSASKKHKLGGNEAAGDIQRVFMGCPMAKFSSVLMKFSFGSTAGSDGNLEYDGPATSVSEAAATDPKTKVKRGRVNNWTGRRSKLRTPAGGPSSDEHDERCPLLGPVSHFILLKKTVETAMSRTQGYLQSVLRRKSMVASSQ